MFNASDFRAVINTQDVLRNNEFLVRFNLPFGMFQTEKGPDNLNTMRYIQWWCQAAELPGIQLITGQGTRYGYGGIEKRPYMPFYDDFQVTFISDADADNWQVMNDWISLVVGTNMSQGIIGQTHDVNIGGAIQRYLPYELNYKTDYVTDINLQVFNSVGDQVKSVIIRDAYPISVGKVQLAWDDNNSYARIPVTFAYTDYFVEPILVVPGPVIVGGF
jgi:hypothetical protein